MNKILMTKFAIAGYRPVACLDCKKSTGSELAGQPSLRQVAGSHVLLALIDYREPVTAPLYLAMYAAGIPPFPGRTFIPTSCRGYWSCCCYYFYGGPSINTTLS